MNFKFIHYTVFLFLLLCIILFSNLFEVLTSMQTYDSSTSEIHPLTNNVNVLHFEKIIDLDKQTIFDLIYDVRTHPNVLSENIIDVTIIEETRSTLLVEETFAASGLEISMQVQYEKIGNDEQKIEILSGPAQNSKIFLKFIETSSGTLIIVDANLELKKPISFITQFMSESNYYSAFNTIVDAFVKYGKT